MKLLAVVVMVGSIACVRQPSAPSALLSWRATRPLVIAGQSNVVDGGGVSLKRAYACCPVYVVAGNGARIAEWDEGQPFWTQTQAHLAQPLDGFVWWQGESDAENPRYARDLAALMARVRAANGDRRLRLVLVRVLRYLGVRAAQAAYVEADADARLVSVDDLPTDGGDHLTDDGYVAAAQRIVRAIGDGR